MTTIINEPKILVKHANLTVEHAIQWENGTMKPVNLNLISIKCTKKIRVGILIYVAVRKGCG